MSLKRKSARSGFAIRRRTAEYSPKTFVVLGAPRGGTSLLAGALRLAEVFMGEDVDPANNEDRAFNFHGGNLMLLTNPASRYDYLGQIRSTIVSRNSIHAVWGWKDPMAALYIEDILPDLVNPHFILVTRDIAATAMRERIETSGPLRKANERDLYLKKTRQALNLYDAALSIIEGADIPTLFVSYEKAIRNSADLAVQIIDFVGRRSLSGLQRSAVLESIVLFTREGSISADLADRPTPLGRGLDRASDSDLAQFTDLSAVYHRCATLINLKYYDEGLALSKTVLSQVTLGFETYPRLKSNPIVMAEVEAGMSFMAAIAQINLGDGPGSYLALGRFAAIGRYFRMIRHNSELINGMNKEATTLMRSLERDLGK